ncbi:hypothetical protein TDB9533_01222 [Thalassocella blandensis]|nr:hypothetical protein TDB9533_01222 [Thalassocella blandensis]
MSIDSPKYTTSTTNETLASFAKLACCKPWFDDEYQPPTRDELVSLFELAGWKTKKIAQMLGVHYTSEKGSATVRRWRNDEKHPIPYSAWRLALIYAGVVDPNEDLKQWNENEFSRID